MKVITNNSKTIHFNEENLSFSIKFDNTVWNWSKDYVPKMVCKEGEIFFRDAEKISHQEYSSGTGCGIRSHYEGFKIEGSVIPYAFDTLVWVEEATGDVFFEWIPVIEEGLNVEKVFWPGEMEFEEKKETWYTLLNQEQGMLIPNTWKEELKPIIFDGFFETAGGYMPWFGQVKDGSGYIAICVTPWNAGYQATHPAEGPYTHVSVRFEPSLGKMDYRRIMKYTFLSDCDYNDLCKVYRKVCKMSREDFGL